MLAAVTVLNLCSERLFQISQWSKSTYFSPQIAELQKWIWPKKMIWPKRPRLVLFSFNFFFEPLSEPLQ